MSIKPCCLVYLPDAEDAPNTDLRVLRRNPSLWHGEIERHAAGSEVAAVFAPNHPEIATAYLLAGIATMTLPEPSGGEGSDPPDDEDEAQEEGNGIREPEDEPEDGEEPEATGKKPKSKRKSTT